MINPYDGVNWESINYIHSLSHAHSRKKNNDGTPGTVYQYYLDNAVNGKAKHIAFSNYYPSEPFDPLTDWFQNVPNDIISSPNAEHHNFGVTNGCHVNGLGCTLVSGQNGGLSPIGMAFNGIKTWQDAFRSILNTLVYDDAGGITINHPVWSELSDSIVEKMLDYDTEKVLGIEIASAVDVPGMIIDGINTGWAVEMWDRILSKGRRCWGLAAPDHGTERTSQWTGRNVLLVNSIDSYSCLKAYRDGRFYSKIYDSDLAFNEIKLHGNILTASAQLADSMSVVIDGTYHDFESNSIIFEIPSNTIYCRVEAHMNYNWTNASGNIEPVMEKIFSNPIIFKVMKHHSKSTEYLQRVYDL